MNPVFFVTDLHGRIDRYEKLFDLIKKEVPACLLIGGDLLPHRLRAQQWNNRIIEHFVGDYLEPAFEDLFTEMGSSYPAVFLILGNDDPRSEEKSFLGGESKGLWTNIHFKKIPFHDFSVYGYAFVPPTPFRLKDWEKYDVSRFLDPGSLAPDEGFRTVEPDYDPGYDTIKKDLEIFTQGEDLRKAVFLFHSPPYKTYHDRAALDGQTFDHVPLDVHVGSIAIKEFIETRHPFITLHGHIHESSRITGHWKQCLGRTMTFSAAWDGSELSVIKVDLDDPEHASRMLI